MKSPLLVLVLLLSGCASHLSVGQRYLDTGKTELSTLYFARAYLLDPQSVEKKSKLQDAITLAVRNLDATYDQHLTDKNFRSAFGTAVRKEELLLWAENLQLEGFNSATAQTQVERARTAALRETLAAVDNKALEDGASDELLKSLRAALALAPDHTELNERYHQLRSRLTRHLHLDPYCSHSDPNICKEIIQRIGQQITAANRELITLVPKNSEKVDARLRIAVSIKEKDSSWRRLRTGNAQSKITKYDQFKKVIKNSQGKTQTRIVRASFSTFVRKTSAVVNLRVKVLDLKAGQAPLFSGTSQKTRESKAHFYQWSGDERALSGTLGVTSMGTDQTPPTPAVVLARQAWESAADEIASKIIAELETL